MAATPIYRAMMSELERRRLQLGISMGGEGGLSDLAGIPDRYYAKVLWADTPSGRQARWEVIQELVDTMFPEGVDLILRPTTNGPMTEVQQRRKLRFTAANYDRRLQRDLMTEIGAKGGLAKVPLWKRRAIARKGGRARARKARERAKLAASLAREAQTGPAAT